MKKQIISVVLAIAATVSLVGCNDNSGITTNSSNTSVSSENKSSSDTSIASGSGNSTASSSSNNSNASSGNTSGSNTGSASTNEDTSSSESGSATSSGDATAILNAPLPIVYKATAPVFEKADENAAVPTSLEFLKATGANIDKSDSVIINAKLKGKTQHPKLYDPIAIEQNYTFVITKNATYLRVAHTDSEYSPAVTAYEEYSVMNDDGTFSTIVKSGDKWVATKSEYALDGSDAPWEAKIPTELRYDKDLVYEYTGANVYENSIDKFGPMRLFASDFATKDRFGDDDMIVSMPIVRDENKNLVLAFDSWKQAGCGTSDSIYVWHILENFFRYAPVEEMKWTKGYIPNITHLTDDTTITHTVGNDYLLKSLTGRFTEGYHYDITFEFEFTNWDNIEKINVPDYVTE